MSSLPVEFKIERRDCCQMERNLMNRIYHLGEAHMEEMRTMKGAKEDAAAMAFCPLCEDVVEFHNSVQRAEHMRVHHPQPPGKKQIVKFACGLCGKRKTKTGKLGMDTASFQTHLVCEHQIKALAFECPVKGCSYASVKQSLKDHLKTHGLRTKDAWTPFLELSSTQVVPTTLANGTKTTKDRKWVSNDCRHCGMKFDHVQDLQRHVHAHHFHTLTEEEKDRFVCPHCFRRHPTNTAMHDCIKRCTGVTRTCPHCGDEVPYHSLFRHIQKEHNDSNLFVCSVAGCNKSFATKSELSEHHERHDNKRAFVCDVVCREGTTVPVEDADEAGELCGHASNTYRDLWWHKRLVHSKGEFPCDQCGAICSNHRYLEAHRVRCHGEKTFACSADGCDYCCTTREQLDRHVLVHSPPTHECEDCKRMFRTADQLRLHRDYYHTDARVHECDKCHERFYSPMSLDRHQKTFQGFCGEFRRGCGSKGEQMISYLLDLNSIPFQREVRVPRRDITGDPTDQGMLRFDFRCEFEGMTVFIEYDGRFHFHPSTLVPRPVRGDVFIKSVSRDLAKGRYIKSLPNCRMVRITGSYIADKFYALLAALNSEQDTQLTWLSKEGRPLKYFMAFSAGSSSTSTRIRPPENWPVISPVSHLVSTDADLFASKTSILYRLREWEGTLRPLTSEDAWALAQELNHPPSIRDMDWYPYLDALFFLFCRQNAEVDSLECLDRHAVDIAYNVLSRMPELSFLKPADAPPPTTSTTKRRRPPAPRRALPEPEAGGASDDLFGTSRFD